MSKRVLLTDRGLQALTKRRAPAGVRLVIWDAAVAHFGVRVTENGHVSFSLQRRFRRKVRRWTLGTYPAMQLVDAREKARDYLRDIARDVDPATKIETARRDEARRHRGTVAALAADFIENHVKKLRSRKAVEAAINREIVKRWGKRTAAEIEHGDVVDMVREVAKASGPYAAYRLLAYASKMFNWAIGQNSYGIKSSPTERVSPADTIGGRAERTRVLGDQELRDLWAACTALVDPFGHLCKFLLLTAVRRDEAARAQRIEFDLDKAEWIIPPSRMKSGRAHVVPLSREAVSLLRSLPKRASGEFVFSTTDGLKAVSGFSKLKKKLDAKLLEIVRERAVAAAADPRKVKLEPFQIHDLRRSARTHFSALPVQDIVRELAIAHAKGKLHKVYDQYAYLDERRSLFEQWATRLAGILNPAQGEVIELGAARRQSARSG